MGWQFAAIGPTLRRALAMKSGIGSLRFSFHFGDRRFRVLETELQLSFGKAFGLRAIVQAAQRAQQMFQLRVTDRQRVAFNDNVYNLRLHLTDGVGGLLRWKCLF